MYKVFKKKYHVLNTLQGTFMKFKRDQGRIGL